MDRINGAGTIDIGGGKRGFRSEDLPTGTEGTEVTDEWLNAVQENILKVIEEAGLALDVDNWSLLWQAIRFSQMADGYFSVTDIRNDPPAGPAVGDRYIVGSVPTGAWVGHEDEIALWLGAWTFISPKPWMHVGLADRTDWRWDHTLGTPAWVQWQGSETLLGPVRLATALEVDSGDGDGAVTAEQMAAAKAFGVELTSAKTQLYGSAATTVGTDWVASNENLSDAVYDDVTGTLTIGPKSAGIWAISVQNYFNTSTTTQAYTFLRRAASPGPIDPATDQYQFGTNPGTLASQTSFMRLEDGDRVAIGGYQNSGSARYNKKSAAPEDPGFGSMIRISG